MKRPPVLSTIIVAVAVAAMIALGIWQLQRRTWKEALLARYEENTRLPRMAFPRVAQGEAYLYRRAGAFCLQPVNWRVEGAGRFGWRVLADCRTGAEGPGFTAELGLSRDPNVKPAWKGGPITGTIAPAPSHDSLIATLSGKAAETGLMLVADQPVAGLTPPPAPSPASIPNNHLAYAVQWFIFAALAAIIYAIALVRRQRRGA